MERDIEIKGRSRGQVKGSLMWRGHGKEKGDRKYIEGGLKGNTYITLLTMGNGTH